MLLDNIDAVLANHKNHSLVQIVVPNSLERMQSVIVGFDAYQNEILLGGIYPQPSIKALQHIAENPFWIQCQHNGQFLNMSVRIVELIRNADLITAKVQSTQVTSNKRWTPRTNFCSHQGPEVEILPMFGTIEKGWIKNLSYNGALIETFGKDIRPQLGNKQELAIRVHFNQFFHLDTKVTIKQCYFKRTPCCHSGLRVQFTHLTAVQAQQIQEFVSQTTETPLVA